MGRGMYGVVSLAPILEGQAAAVARARRADRCRTALGQRRGNRDTRALAAAGRSLLLLLLLHSLIWGYTDLCGYADDAPSARGLHIRESTGFAATSGPPRAAGTSVVRRK